MDSNASEKKEQQAAMRCKLNILFAEVISTHKNTGFTPKNKVEKRLELS